MIEAVSDSNLHEVLPLIRQYQAFYQAQSICDERNREFFSQFAEGADGGCQFIYRAADGAAVAFATVYFSFASSIPGKVGIMSDLYTVPAYRGRGAGKSLINHCLEFAKSRNAVRLQWLTAEDNKPAQLLYDSLNTNSASWKVYTYSG